ncbi:MAG: hypothetical protein FWG27_05825 [Treponema sp.]|nr:hypothetical protein [Treponema sp.]
MIKFRCALGLSFWCLFIGLQAQAQERLLADLPEEIRDRALVLRITTKVAENSQEVWNSYNSKITIPGRPVGIKLVGENLIIAVQLTPYLRDGRFTLVAQSQIWINIPDKGMSYKTNTYSIPLEVGEPILYFPLGSDPASDTPLIELYLTMYRYGEEPEETPLGDTNLEMESAVLPEGRTGHRRPR